MDKKIERELVKSIKKPIITDKTTKLLENNQYCFYVNPEIDKTKVKQAIEYFFDVKVIKVNACHAPRKKRKVGRFQGYKSSYKKAIVKLASNERINLFSQE